MNRFLIILMLSLSIAGFAQQGQNRFDQEASQNIEENNRTSPQEESQPDVSNIGVPGNPGEDPVPIDNYLPLLLTTALGIILYTTQKKKKLLS